MEGLVVRLVDNGPEAFSAAEVVNAVHQAFPRLGDRSRSVPIIALRVTRLASAPSPQSSTPFGRCGTTTYRPSDVDSPTRPCGLSSTKTPNSSKTPRGARTTRARYSFDLYQDGDRPRMENG